MDDDPEDKSKKMLIITVFNQNAILAQWDFEINSLEQNSKAWQIVNLELTPIYKLHF